MTEARSFSVYLSPAEFEAMDRLKKKFFRSSSTDLIRFLINATDSGFFIADLNYNTKQPQTNPRRQSR